MSATDDDWADLAERARMTAAARPSRTYPPARLSDIVEARYRLHVTDRAAALGVPEGLLLELIEGAQRWDG